MKVPRSVFTIAFFTLVSKVSGFVRDIVFANVLGSGILADAFFAASRLPNTFRRIFAEGAMTSAFVPLFAPDWKSDKKKAIVFMNRVFSFLFVSVVCLIVLCEVFMPFITKVFTPGLVSRDFEMVVTMSRIMFPFLILITIAAFGGAVLNSVGYVWYFAFAPVLGNLVLIIGFLFFKVDVVITSLVFLFSGLGQLVIVYYGLKRQDFDLKFDFSFSFKDGQIKQFFKNFSVSALSNGIMQINVFVDTVFLSFFAGGISYFYYTDRLVQLPISVIGYSISVGVLPLLSIALKHGDVENYSQVQKGAINMGLFLSLIGCVFLIGFANDIVKIVYGGRGFAVNDIENVAKMIIVYAFSVPFVIVSKILNSCLMSANRNAIIFKVNVFALIVNLLMNLALFRFFGMFCVVIATLLSSVCSCVLMCYFAKDSNLLFYSIYDLLKYCKMIIVGIVFVCAGRLFGSFDSKFWLLLRMDMVFCCYFILLYFIGYKDDILALRSLISRKGQG
jgi:putative peptidoglycan lipid II flippase